MSTSSCCAELVSIGPLPLTWPRVATLAATRGHPPLSRHCVRLTGRLRQVRKSCSVAVAADLLTQGPGDSDASRLRPSHNLLRPAAQNSYLAGPFRYSCPRMDTPPAPWPPRPATSHSAFHRCLRHLSACLFSAVLLSPLRPAAGPPPAPVQRRPTSGQLTGPRLMSPLIRRIKY